MRDICKNIKIFTFITFLAFLIVSCKSSKAPRSSAKAPETKTEKVIKTARSYTGTKYKFGGTSRAGLDCSGLVLLSFKAAGIELPRTSAQQSETGKKVKLKKLKEGDLVFFSAKKRSKKITHVGIVTEKRGPKDIRFIHASTKAGVVENNLFAPYYISVFRKGRRIF